jgi:hypothetical protein
MKIPVGLARCAETSDRRFSDTPAHGLCVPEGQLVSSGLLAPARARVPRDREPRHDGRGLGIQRHVERRAVPGSVAKLISNVLRNDNIPSLQ